MGRKPKSVRSYKKTIFDTAFSYYIRLRDCLKTTNTREYGICITCDKVVHIKEADAGHFISGHHNELYFDETNCHLQCRYCNRYLDGNQLVYRRKIVEMYGEGYDEELERRDKITKKFTIQELQELREGFKQKIKRLEREEI